MKSITISIILLLCLCFPLRGAEKPWSHGDLRVADNGLYLQHEDGTPFFWLGDTGWLLPQRLDRDEAQHYLEQTASEGYNVVQIQVLNGVPSFNRYGSMSNPDVWNMDAASKPGEYGYCGHRRYGQRMGNKDYPIPDGTEEDGSLHYIGSTGDRIFSHNRIRGRTWC